MGSERGVTLHGALPVATRASGGAHDIAGCGVAHVERQQSALELCVRIAAGR